MSFGVNLQPMWPIGDIGPIRELIAGTASKRLPAFGLSGLLPMFAVRPNGAKDTRLGGVFCLRCWRLPGDLRWCRIWARPFYAGRTFHNPDLPRCPKAAGFLLAQFRFAI